MTREEKVSLVETYLDSFQTRDLSNLSLAEDITFEGPRMPKLAGRPTVLGFLTQILPMVKSIEIKQHIVEGDYVATVFDMETINGTDHVFTESTSWKTRSNQSTPSTTRIRRRSNKWIP